LVWPTYGACPPLKGGAEVPQEASQVITFALFLDATPHGPKPYTHYSLSLVRASRTLTPYRSNGEGDFGGADLHEGCSPSCWYVG
jgi:hypothetical protein